MWTRFELHAGEFPDHRGSFNSANGLWKLCRGHMVLFGHEHAKVDNDLVCRAWFADPLGSSPQG